MGYWPTGVKREETVECFVQAFATLGYEESESGALEEGLEKLAIYAVEDKVTHMAIQLRSGIWSNKLGDLEDIEHGRLQDIECQTYGSVHQASYPERRTLVFAHRPLAA
jgi:hypothetical protein